MPLDEKKKIQAWVPVSIYNQIESFGFKSQNEAVNFAFVKLLEIQDMNQDESKVNQNDSILINQLQARLDEKDNWIKELQDHNETLKKELDKASHDKDDLKNMHNNYFLQVQTLINQKAIGTSPIYNTPINEEVKTKPVTRKAESKQQIEKICKNCNQPFLTENPKKETCSSKCRAAYSRRIRSSD